jgi:hypothetical protein
MLLQGYTSQEIQAAIKEEAKVASPYPENMVKAALEYPEVKEKIMNNLYTKQTADQDVAKSLLTTYTYNKIQATKLIAENSINPKRPPRSNDAIKWASAIVSAAQKSITPPQKSNSMSH